MSVVKLPSLDRYWSQNKMYGQSVVSNFMTKKRFQAILAFLQITPPADIDKGITNLAYNTKVKEKIYIDYHC